ncbi:Protein of unknown function [Pyronema omphalodes CBS 100304]|uniref:Uncharacterized protein n=1 Tax=Pyronema omphalodes (strain CBS 100304) TaxID=1076935 RepID=U4LJV3_PYROM|nr:Protein of unknown function [Pyronema omphalodes CBS 100304]
MACRNRRIITFTHPRITWTVEVADWLVVGRPVKLRPLYSSSTPHLGKYELGCE